MKKFFAKLIGWQEQRGDPKKFHPSEKIKQDMAREHVEEAGQRERERIERESGGKRKEPRQEEILGPSETKEV